MSLYQRLLPYGVAIGCTITALVLNPWLESPIPQSLLLIAVAMSAWYGGQQSRQSNRDNIDRLKLALSAAQMGLWDWDMITGEILWSPEHERLFGLAPGEFDGRYETFEKCLHPDDRDALNQAIAQSLDDRTPYHHEYRVVWADGSIHWMEGRGQAFYSATGQPIQMSGTIMAIDEHKRLELALKQSEQQFRAIFEAEPECIKVVTAEGILHNMNPAGLAMVEVDSLEQVRGQNICPLVNPDYQQAFLDFTQRVTQGEAATLEFEIIGLKGTRRRLESHAVPLQAPDQDVPLMLSVTRDITEQKQAEQALQESERSLSTLISNLPGYVYRVANDSDYTPEFISEGVFAITGYRQSEYLVDRTASCRQAIHPNDVDLVWDTVQHAIQTHQPYECVYRITTKSGAQKWLWERGRGVYTEAGELRCLEGFVTDVTDRKQAEIALQQAKVDLELRVGDRTAKLQQQTRQKQLLWNITQAIRQSLDLEIILNAAVNEVRELLDIDRVAVYRFNSDWSGDFITESVTDDWVKLVQPNVNKVWEDTYLQETQGGRFQNHETLTVTDIYTAELQPCHVELLEQFQARAYAIAPIFMGDSLWGLLALYQNAAPHRWKSWEVELLEQIASQLAIAIQQSAIYSQLQIELQERKQATAVLREAERRWRSLLDNVQLIVVGLDHSGNVNYINPFFLSLTGYTRSEVLGKSWFKNFLPPSHQEIVETAFSEVLLQNAHPYYQNSILTKSGEERLIAWNNTMLKNSDETIMGTISIGEDITERQQLEKIKNEFIGIVSHELRTPLTAIQMSLGLLKTGIYAKKPEKSQRMIEIALTDTNRLVNLVNDILDLERLESGRAALEKTVCRAADLMEQAVNGVQAIAAQQSITLHINPTEATVWAAADTIVQTLTNLLSNAIKFSPADSVIRLSADRQDDQVLFQVSDQGRGIPADKLETIFGRFQQVDVSDSRQKGGTGLGLPICRSIIERHGGKIWVESTMGTGSTFFFTLPLPLHVE